MKKKWQHFVAEDISYSGLRCVRLTHKANEYDTKPRTIYLIEWNRLYEIAASTRYPFTFEYQRPTQERKYPVIKIIAGPGVSIKFENLPIDDFFYEPTYSKPKIDIIRVQDALAIPPPASDITTLNYCTPQEYGGKTPDDPDPNYVRVERFPNEVVIHHPFGQRSVSIWVKPNAESKNDNSDAEMRFAYEIHEEVLKYDPGRPLVTIVKTNKVKVREAKVPGSDRYNFFKIYNTESDDVDDVPVQGRHIQVGQRWKEFKPAKDPDLTMELAKFGADVGISLIPVVGDISDIGEFVYGLSTGKDKWGNKLGTSDHVLMGVGALLPFVGGAVLLRGKKFVERFGQKAELAAELATDFEKAGLGASTGERETIEKMIKLLKEGKTPPAEMYYELQGALKRINADFPPIVYFITEDGKGFSHPDLQELYQKYRQSKSDPLDPLKWASSIGHGRADDIFKKLIGPDYRKVPKSVYQAADINVIDVARPDTLKELKLKECFDLLFSERAKLEEVHKKVIEAAQQLFGKEKIEFASKLGEGDFNRLKGAIAELLSMHMQYDILRDIRRSGEPSAVLVSGVMMQMMDPATKKLSNAVQFSDNLIVVRRGEMLEIKALFEVKSGPKGGQEAQSQVFDWIEDKITSGSNVVFPKGAKIITKKGVEEIVETEMKFTYIPTVPKGSKFPADFPNTAIYLTSADRYAIVAEGASQLGMKSSQQVAKEVNRRVLKLPSGHEVTSKELDYLTAQIAQALIN